MSPVQTPRRLVNPMAGAGRAFLDGAAAIAERIRGTLLEIHGKQLSSDIEWYAYSQRFTALDSGGVLTLPIQIEASSDFIWTHAMAFVTESSTGVPFLAYQGANAAVAYRSWPLRISILDSGLQRQMLQQETALWCLFGDGAMDPYELPRPRLFKRQSTISVTLRRIAEGQLTPGTGAATNLNLDAELIYAGYKIFDPRLQNLTN